MVEPQKFTFFVYIVESPSAPDLYHGRSEGERVASTLRLDGVPCVTRTAISQEAFVAALRVGLPEAMKQFPGHYPVLHLSAHGSSSGLQLSSGQVITWVELRAMLTPINQSLNGALLLSMSACEGYSACQMAMQESDAPHPYYVMVGNCGTPTWSDTAVAYLAFYHLLAKGRLIPEAVAAMSAASGDSKWLVEIADESKQGYIEFLKLQATPSQIQQQLETAANHEPLPATAKALEAGTGG
jgi:hypothetical protein